MLRNTTQDIQRKQLGLLLVVRLVVGLACIGAQLLSTPVGLLGFGGEALYLLAVGVALSVLYYTVARYTSRPGGVTFLVMLVDIGLVSFLIYLTGGNQSNYTYLYFAIIVGASILISERASLLFASTSTVGLSAITTLTFLSNHYTWNLPLIGDDPVSRASQNASFVLGYLLAQGVALHLVALLSGSLAKRIERLNSLTDSILKYMAGGVVVASQTGQLQYLNEPAHQMLGFGPRENLIGKSIHEVFRRNSDQSLKYALQQFEEAEREVVFPRRSGNLYVEVKSRVLKDPQGRDIGIMALLNDVTENHLMKEAQRQAETLAGIEEMAAGIAHEIRNPLASIRGSVQELGKAEGLDQDQQTLVRIVLKESDRLNGIITDFLKFTRMRPTQSTSCDLAVTLRDLVILVGNQAPKQDIEVLVKGSIPDTLPCTGDREQIKQLVLNLAINAIEAMEGGGILRIEAHRQARPDSTLPESEDRRAPAGSGGVSIHVSDTGSGVVKKEQDVIFAPFYTTKAKGTGMGLSIVQKIVTAHGGTVQVENNLSGGATFSVWIPDHPMSNNLINRNNDAVDSHYNENDWEQDDNQSSTRVRLEKEPLRGVHVTHE